MDRSASSSATHADVRRRFVLESDVRPVTSRMEQAAFDVLLNKRAWREPSLERRGAWVPVAGTRNPSGATYVFRKTSRLHADRECSGTIYRDHADEAARIQS